jgi:hypothetical protein
VGLSPYVLIGYWGVVLRLSINPSILTTRRPRVRIAIGRKPALVTCMLRATDLTGPQMRPNFTICPKRPAASEHRDRRGRSPNPSVDPHRGRECRAAGAASARPTLKEWRGHTEPGARSGDLADDLARTKRPYRWRGGDSLCGSADASAFMGSYPRSLNAYVPDQVWALRPGSSGCLWRNV